MSDVASLLQAAVQHHQAGRLDEARRGYAAVLEAEPEHADARHLSGLIAYQEGKFEEALALIDGAIARQPDVAMYHANRGRVLKAAGENAAAAAAVRRALSLQPGDPSLLSDLAGALVDGGDADVAMLFARRAIERAPDLAPAHHNFGLAAAMLGQPYSARPAFERAVELDPAFAPALFELGRIHQEKNAPDQAETYYRSALAADPLMLEAHVNLGNILRARMDLEDAIGHFRQALEIDGTQAAVHGNLGVALQDAGDPEAALLAYDCALELAPGDAEVERNRAQALLQLGRLEEGWPVFERRWRTRRFAAIRRDWPCPQWNGERGEDLTVLVHAEQGFGDTIQFSRYLPLLAERVGRVLVECPPPVAALISRCQGVDDIVAAGSPLPGFDRHIPMMSLPGAFRTDLGSIPAQIPYLKVSPELAAAWSERLGPRDGLRVGLVWKGSRRHQWNTWRSPGLAAFDALLKAPGVNWISLQKDDETADLQARGLTDAFLALGGQVRDFSDTAAALMHLDLIISPDTAVAHLAGAMGRPVWLILPHVAEWRWLTDREDSPWYPTMRLFRQNVRGDWRGPVSMMLVALRELAETSS